MIMGNNVKIGTCVLIADTDAHPMLAQSLLQL